jgi:hypothetical protein
MVKPIDLTLRKTQGGRRKVRHRHKRKVLRRSERPTIAVLNTLAQGEYDPTWIEGLPLGPTRTAVEGLYNKLRAEQDLGDGISTLRDLMIRRVVYFDYWLARVDATLQQYDGELLLGNNTPAMERDMLVCAQCYALMTRALAHVAFALGVDAKGDATQNARRRREKKKASGLELPDL